MTSWNLFSHVCETRNFGTVLLLSKQGVLCDKLLFFHYTGLTSIINAEENARLSFVAFVEDNATMCSILWKSCIVFCAKPKEVDPIELISLRQMSASVALKYIINNGVLKYTESGSSMIATPFFDKNIYNRYIVRLAQWYTKLLSPDGVHPQINSSLWLLVLYLVRPDLFVIHYCLFIFTKNSFLSLALMRNATPAFTTLWLSKALESACTCIGKPCRSHQTFFRLFFFIFYG